MLRTALAYASVILLGSLSSAVAAQGPERTIDTAHSVLKVRVFKSGIFSALAHDHEIEAPVAGGTVRLSVDPGVTLSVHASDLRVLDPELPSGKREDVQRTMEGPDVLDIRRFPDISFQSSTIQKKDNQHWIVRGNLTLHGQTSPVDVEVAEKDGHYEGSAALQPRAFGIKPVAIAGGTVKVKDEVKIEFAIALK